MYRNLVYYTSIFLNVIGVFIFLHQTSSPKKTNGVQPERTQSPLATRLLKVRYLRFTRDLVVSQNFSSKSTNDFCYFSMFCFSLLIFMLTSILSATDRCIFTLIIMHIPHILLLIRLKKSQSTGSFEAELFLNSLYTQYRITGRIADALDIVLIDSKGIDILIKPAFRLSAALKDYKGVGELREALDQFEFSVGTQWSKKLCNIIFSDVHEGVNQFTAMESLLSDLEYGRKIYEQHSRFNSDTLVIIKYIIPVMYIGTIYGALGLLDMSVKDFIRNQFINPIGLKLFLCLVVLETINIIILYTIEHRKMDSIS